MPCSGGWIRQRPRPGDAPMPFMISTTLADPRAAAAIPSGDDDAAPSLLGSEWLVEALGCPAARLQDLERLQSVCEQVLRELHLNRIGAPLWHRFPEPGGVTGLYLLAESHLACHTYPEHGVATFNLYCCRPREPWPWELRLRETLAATTVQVRVCPRGPRLNALPLADREEQR